MKNKLPLPLCKYGYTKEQIDDILGERSEEFNRWMYGQTMALCDGREYDYAKKEYRSSDCGPHGSITYKWDLERFLAGLPIID